MPIVTISDNTRNVTTLNVYRSSGYYTPGGDVRFEGANSWNDQPRVTTGSQDFTSPEKLRQFATACLLAANLLESGEAQREDCTCLAGTQCQCIARAL